VRDHLEHQGLLSYSESSRADSGMSGKGLSGDFRLQLQLLDRVCEQAQLLQSIHQQQQLSKLQVEGIRRQITQEHQKLGDRVVGLLEDEQSETRSLQIAQHRLLGELERPLTRISSLTSLTSPGTPKLSASKNPLRSQVSSRTSAGTTESIVSRPETPCSSSLTLQLSMVPTTRFQVFVKGRIFESICAAMIISNTFLIAITVQVDVDHAWLHGGKPNTSQFRRILTLASYFFTIFYTLEALTKFIAFGKTFFTGPDWRWNLFDLTLVLMAIYDFLAEQTNFMIQGENMTWLRVLRLVKMLKILRVVRVMRFFKELRMMLISIVGSLSALFWSIIALFLVTFTFGLCFLQALTTNVMESSSINEETLDLINRYWNSVPSATLTLYMSVTGGADWQDLALPLGQLGSGIIYHYLFLFYIAFSTVAVLNVVTGLFVDAAMEVRKADNRNVMSELLKHEGPQIDSFKTLAEDGRITMAILRQHLSEPVMKHFLKSMDITARDLQMVFHRLPHKEMPAKGLHPKKMCVEVDDFVEACSKVNGDLEGLDMMRYLGENRKFIVATHRFMEYVEDRFHSVQRKFRQVGVEVEHLERLADRLSSARCLPADWHGLRRTGKDKQKQKLMEASCRRRRSADYPVPFI